MLFKGYYLNKGALNMLQYKSKHKKYSKFETQKSSVQ